MQTDLFIFAWMGVALVLGTFSALLGADKLLKLLVANIFFMFGIMTLYGSMSFLHDSITTYQQTLPVDEQTKWETIKIVLANAPKTLGILLYCVMVFVLFTRVDDFLKLPRHGIQYILSHGSLIVLAIVGFILVITTILFGSDMFSYAAMRTIVQEMEVQWTLAKFLLFLPHILLIHTVCILRLMYTCVRVIPQHAFEDYESDTD